MSFSTSESTPRRSANLVLALGNDLLGDDGVGLLAARALAADWAEDAEIVESGESGLALLELLEGYRRTLLLDAIQTCQAPPGTVLELRPEDFDCTEAPSPHYAGLPDVIAMARRLGIDFPAEIRILALEVENPCDFRQTLTPAVERAMPRYIEQARRVLTQWREEDARILAHGTRD
jgi:hydrogenase maturation protease